MIRVAPQSIDSQCLSQKKSIRVSNIPVDQYTQVVGIGDQFALRWLCC